MALVEQAPRSLDDNYGYFVELQPLSSPDQTDPEVYEINSHKKKLYDLVCAETEGITIDPGEKEETKRYLQDAIVNRALQIFDAAKENVTDLEALGCAGLFIDEQVGSLTGAILDLYNAEVPEHMRHRPIETIIGERFKGLASVYRQEPEKVDPKILIKDACLNALHFNQREVAAGLRNRSPDTEENWQEPVQLTPEEENPAPVTAPRRLGRLAFSHRFGR